MTILHKAAPVVVIEPLTLVTWAAKSTEFGSRSRVQVERPEILWISETQTTIEFRHGGKLIKEGACFCDVSYADSIESAYERFLDEVESYKVIQSSTLQIQGFTQVEVTPVTRSSETPFGRTRKAYNTIKGNWWTVLDQSDLSDIMMAKTYDEFRALDLPYLQKRTVKTIVPFSSVMAEDLNRDSVARIVSQLRAAAVDIDPPHSTKPPLAPG